MFDILELAGEMHAESPRYDNIPIDPHKAAEVVSNLTNNENCIMLVAFDGDTLAGMFMGYVDEFFFSRVRVSSDLLLYIAPKYRGGSLATRLLVAYEKWAESIEGVAEIQGGVSAGIEDELAKKLYERRGYKTVATVLAKEVKRV